MDELGHSRASDRKDSGNIPVSYPPVPIEAHTPTNTDEIEPEVDEDSVFTVGPADRDNHNSLDIPLEAVQVSGESIENYKDDISSDVLETVTQTQVASEGENVGNRRELESEKASKLDSMEEPANPNEDNGVESIKEDNNIESINTSKTDKEEFSEEKEYQISKEIQLSKSSQH